jgi:phosphatidylserine/phosphatidylglycerophosphate/cardiolipin synthase-like enzyme
MKSRGGVALLAVFRYPPPMKSLSLALMMAFWATVLTAADKMQVFFSPRGGCTEAVVENLSHAKKEVFVQAYSFTSAAIAKALVDAHRRGVKVEVILDRSQRSEKYSDADFLLHMGVPTYIDAKHSAHNKIMIIDGQTVLTGSFNFTSAAEEHNAENLLVST